MKKGGATTTPLVGWTGGKEFPFWGDTEREPILAFPSRSRVRADGSVSLPVLFLLSAGGKGYIARCGIKEKRMLVSDLLSRIRVMNTHRRVEI